MSALEFLSPSRCVPEALASPLARALDTVSDTAPRSDAGLRVEGVRHRLVDLSLDGKVEIRGELDRVAPLGGEELVRLSPRRGLLLVDGDPVEAVERLRAAGLRAYDVTGALAGIAVDGERLLRRLTDLDLGAVPAAGGFARIGAVLVRDEGERFRIYFPQELGHYVAEVVLDTLAGLENTGSDPWGVTPAGGNVGSDPTGLTPDEGRA